MRRFRRILQIVLLTPPFLCFATPSSDALTQDHPCIKEYQLNNFEQAMATCLPAAKLNNAEAQYVIGMLYKRGKGGVQRSDTIATQWLTQSAENGYVAAQLRLGIMLSTTTLPDYAKAFNYFLSAGNQNLFEAQFLVALCYLNGIGVSNDPVLALQWYHKAIANGLDAPMIDRISRAQPSPSVQSSDRFTAMKMAAEHNDANAQFEVARFYLNGQGTEQNDVKALHYFKAAAIQGNQPAKGYLAWMSLLGLGAPSNQQEAIFWFTTYYEKGLVQKPVSILAPASEQEAKNQTKTFYDQALKLLDDHEIDNQKQGVALLTHAANRNFVDAQVSLAKAYQTGKWVKQNSTQAARWFEKAAQQGNHDAQYALGWLYFNGEGVPKDIKLSYYWFDKAALSGGPKAKSAKTFVQTYLPANVTPSKNLLQVYNDVIEEQKSQKMVKTLLKPLSASQQAKNQDRLATR